MSCNTNELNYYKNLITKALAAREALDAAYLIAIEGGVKSYTFDTAEGRQTTVYKKLSEMEDAMDKLDSRIDWWMRKAGPGGGLVSLNLRRKKYNYGCGC